MADTNPAPSVRDGEEVGRLKDLLFRFREFVLERATQWDISKGPCNHHNPIWAEIAEALASAPVPDQSGVGGDVDGLGNGRAICESLGFDPINHHNAERCPYCNPNGWTLQPPAAGLLSTEEERDSLRIRLQEAERALHLAVAAVEDGKFIAPRGETYRAMKLALLTQEESR